MTLEQQSNVTSPPTLTMAVPASRIAQPTEIVEVVRAESELRAIDELMAELTTEFVAEASS